MSKLRHIPGDPHSIGGRPGLIYCKRCGRLLPSRKPCRDVALEMRSKDRRCHSWTTPVLRNVRAVCSLVRGHDGGHVNVERDLWWPRR